jgi:hypothetical protein
LPFKALGRADLLGSEDPAVTSRQCSPLLTCHVVRRTLEASGTAQVGARPAVVSQNAVRVEPSRKSFQLR